MPYFSHTPETLGLRIGRNDSKRPETTCNGITNSGRPCRRALASPKPLPNPRRNPDILSSHGLVTLVQDSERICEADAYCWQHKEQAVPNASTKRGNRNRGEQDERRVDGLFPLRKQTSIDTLVQRLGIDVTSVNGTIAVKSPQQVTRNPMPPRRTEATDFAACQAQCTPYAESYDFVASDKRPSRPKRKSFWASLCCMAIDDTEYVEIVRHKRRIERSRDPEMAVISAQPKQHPMIVAEPVVQPARPVMPGKTVSSRPMRAPTIVPSNPHPSGLLSYIPRHVSPQTTSALLAEMIKPISPSDEQGYIYIFWLTPQTNAQPEASVAQSLLSSSRPPHERSISDVITEYSYDGSSEHDNAWKAQNPRRKQTQTIMLKIGRATNVTRRMNQWQRQCGYALNLVRWYPYIPSTPSPRPPPIAKPLYPDLTRPPPSRYDPEVEAVKKIPCVKRVERLIHLELAQRQVTKRCETCGKDHREWFEIEASQKGVREVDETVRRWVEWAEKNALQQ